MAFNSKLSKNIYSNSYKKFKEIYRPDKLGNKNPSRMRGFFVLVRSVKLLSYLTFLVPISSLMIVLISLKYL